MNLEQYRTHPVRRRLPTGWKVVTRSQALLLWLSGVLLATNGTLILWGLDDGRPLIRMMPPILGVLVAIFIGASALWWVPSPADYQYRQKEAQSAR